MIHLLRKSNFLSFSFKHDKKSNMRNMLLWKKLYDQSGATQPECWPAKVKHDGHTISVLEKAKFFLDVYVRFFDNDDYFSMLETDGIETIAIEDRTWSHYISGAAALMKRYPDIYEAARKQVAQRTQNFMEAHDLETYIAANKREWLDTHALLAGKSINSEDYLPYVFQKLIDKKI